MSIESFEFPFKYVGNTGLVPTSFFDGELKQQHRGENALRSQCLESFTYDGSIGHVFAKVKASMRNRTYDITVRVVRSH